MWRIFCSVYRRKGPFIAASLLVVALVGSVAGTLVMYHHEAGASGDDSGRGERRRVILVAGICSENPAQSMTEIYQWLQDDLDYNASEILLFDYRGTAPLSSGDTYAETDTLIAIDGAGGSAANLRGMINAVARTGDQVLIISHSQGGVVSLFSTLDSPGQAGPSVAGKVHSVVTINSPVQGTDTVRFLGSGIFTCASPLDPSILDMFPNDPLDPNEVVEQITAQVWTGDANPYVITIANNRDPVISEGITDGLRGVLDAAHEHVLQDLGGSLIPFTVHTAPMNVISNSAAGPVRDKLLRALVEYQLRGLFLAGDVYLRPSLSRGPVQPQRLTSGFVGNGDSAVNPGLSRASVQPQRLISGFVGNGDSAVNPGLSRASVQPQRLTNGFVGNGDSAVNPGLSRASVQPQRLTRGFVGNGDSGINPGLSRASLEPQTLTSGFVGNGDVFVKNLLAVPDIRLLQPLEGDCNGDGKVDVWDLLIVAGAFSTQPSLGSCADVNSDGTVDVVDLALVAIAITIAPP